MLSIELAVIRDACSETTNKFYLFLVDVFPLMICIDEMAKLRVIVHGGAFNIADFLVERYKEGTQEAAKTGYEVLKSVSTSHFMKYCFLSFLLTGPLQRYPQTHTHSYIH